MKAIIKTNSDTSSILAETCKVLVPKTGSKVLGALLCRSLPNLGVGQWLIASAIDREVTAIEQGSSQGAAQIALGILKS